MMDLLLLDGRTLAFAYSVSGFLMVATMVGIYLAGMHHRALIDWSIAGMAWALGYLLGHLLLTTPVPIPGWLAGSLTNALIGLGHGFILIGVQRYLGYPVGTHTVVAILLIVFFSTFMVPELRDTLRHRIIMQSGWYVLIDVWAGWLLWQARRPGKRRFQRGMAVVLFSFAAFLTLRLGYAVISPALTTSFVQDPFQIAAFLAAMIFGFCITKAMAVMLFRENQVELEFQARRDPLTGMNNRLSLQEFAENQMAMALRNQSPLAVILFDLDHFKQINDQYGHQAGDQALKVVAECVESVTRGSDTAFRVGGEEFLVVLSDASARHAVAVAERFRSALAQNPVELERATLHLTASFGVVEWKSGQECWDDLVRRADQALYQAKRAGRDQIFAPMHAPVLAPWL